MSVEEVAMDLTALCRSGHFEEATRKYYAEDIVSVEGMGENPVSNGLPAVLAKMQWWAENFEVHEMVVNGPFVNTNTDTFAVEFIMDCTMKQSGERSEMREVGVYTVKDGKIVHEQFLAYGEE